MRNRPMLLGRILRIVTIMLIAPIIDDAPARCILRMAISTDGPDCAFIPLRGGYNVHPVPAPSRNVDEIRR